MFEHLDDPVPPMFTADTHDAVHRRMEALRRRRTSQVAGVLLAVMVVLGAVAVTAGRDEQSLPADHTDVEAMPPLTTTTTMRRPPVDVTGRRANVDKATGPLEGWSLEMYPNVVEGRPITLWLSVLDPDGPVPRLVSIDYGDGRVERPPRPPCPPAASIPAAERRGPHWFHNMRNSTGEPPPLWRHTYHPGDDLDVTVKVVMESGCGALRPTRSTVEFDFTVFRPWPGLDPDLY